MKVKRKSKETQSNELNEVARACLSTIIDKRDGWGNLKDDLMFAPEDWDAISMIFHRFETNHNSDFWPEWNRFAEGKSSTHMTTNVLRRQYDAEIMERQKELATETWQRDPELARMCVIVLRNVKRPLVLPEVEQRTAFIREIERLDRVLTPAQKKKAATARKNGLSGGRPQEDPALTKTAVGQVRTDLDKKIFKTMKAACEHWAKELILPIKWAGLADHVRKGWKRKA